MPSTIQIRHDLRVVAAIDAVGNAHPWSSSQSAEALSEFKAELARAHEITPDQAHLIVERFGAMMVDGASGPKARRGPTGRVA